MDPKPVTKSAGYPNPKVESLMSHVGDFEPVDFIDGALAFLDQSSLVDARTYRKVKALLDECRPEEDTVDAEVDGKPMVVSVEESDADDIDHGPHDGSLALTL